MPAFTDEGLAAIDAIVQDAVRAQQAPGIVTGVASGEDVHVFTAGDATIGGAPMRRDTVFRLASVTKPMTAAAVLSLIDQQGSLGLDDPVGRWLPELRERQVLRRPDGPLTDTVPAQREITVRDLLTFTWGFGMQGAMFVAARPWPIQLATDERNLNTFGGPEPTTTPAPDTWLARLAELPLMLQPGSKWLYQSGSQVLGVLVARVAGRPFDEVLREQLLTPLGMQDTAFHAADTARLATAYRRVDGEFLVSDPPDGRWSQPPAFPDGGAGLVSTVDDVLRFGRMLQRGGSPVLTVGMVAAMTRDQLTPDQRHCDLPGFDMLDGEGWGYGLRISGDGRYGWDGGSGTTWSNVPDLDLTVVTLTQREWDETGPPAVCADVLHAARAAVVTH